MRRHAAWMVLAAVGIVGYAAASAVLIALFEPIFDEVLLSAPPEGLGLLGGGAGGGSEAAAGGETVDSAAGRATADPGAADDPPGWVQRWKQKLNLKRHLTAAYEAAKVAFGVDAESVVLFVPLLFVAAFLLRSVADFTSGYAFQHIGLGATTDIRNDLYRRILDQSSRFYMAHPSGELVSRVVNDIALIQSAISSRLLDVFQQGLTLLVLTALLISSSPELALICLVVAPILVYPIVRFGKGMRRTSHRSQERMADLANLVNEGVRGHRVVKAFAMEEFEHRRFAAATARHLRVNLVGQLLSNLSSPVVESLAAVGAGALLVFAGNAIRSGQLETGLLMSVLLNLFAMYDPIRKLNKVNLILQQSLAAAQRVRDLMAVPVDVVDRPGARELVGFSEAIHFDRVRFAYGQKAVLQDLDFTIRCGEMVALVGPSGAGKSTIASLLPRFYDPDAGAIRIDGIDVRDLTLASLRRHIALVTQETVLFNDTVRANIAYGRADIPLAAIREAAVAAYADEFIAELPEGYETVIGEGGSSLSGGQRQRLAIARAILRDAPILVLDEATSALDTESEQVVQKALANLTRGRTVLVIAHRLSTIRSADRILVIDGGRVVEQGSHDELLAQGGLYKRLHDLQFAG